MDDCMNGWMDSLMTAQGKVLCLAIPQIGIKVENGPSEFGGQV
jgi:hypothetical protein